MSDQTKPDKQTKKKLELNKETIQELNDEQLNQVAGGLENSYGICKGTEKPVPVSERRFDINTQPIQCPEH